MAVITIAGAGMMGTATAYPLADNGHEVRLLGTHLDGDIIESCRERHYHPRLRRDLPRGVQAYFCDEVAQALEGAEIIVSGVNSLGVRWVARTISPYLRPGQSIIAVTKGLEVAENGDLVILPDVLKSELPPGVRDNVSIAAIGGPCIAGELAGRRPSCVVFGSRDRGAAERLAAVFRTPYYSVWTTTDLVGLELCAALKNAYALGAGLVQGLLEGSGGSDAAGAHMHNLAAAVFAQGCTEIDRVLQLAGATRAFAYGLPGAGDLFVTVQGGRTVRLGRLLGLGHRFAEAQAMLAGETLEGAAIVRTMGDALPRLEAREIITTQELPLMRALVDIIVAGHAADLALTGVFRGSAFRS